MNFFFIEEILLDIIDEKVLSDKCDECDKSFSTKGNLKKHKDKVHVLGFFSKKHFFLPDNSFNCTHCGKIFTHKGNYNKHVATHENSTYECSDCEKTFKNKVSLYRHSKIHQNPELVICFKK